MERDNLGYPLLAIEIVHLVLGFFLVAVALRAYKRTGSKAMILLTLGFGLMVTGDTVIEDILFRVYHDYELTRLISEIFEIMAFILLVYAVKKG